MRGKKCIPCCVRKLLVYIKKEKMGKWDKELEGIVKTASAAVSDEGRWNDVLTGLCRRFGAIGG